MTTALVLPTEDDIRLTLAMLYGEDATAVKLDDKPDFDFVGLYVDDDDKPVAAMACDFPFAAYAGASLTMIPPGGAEACIEDGELTEMMVANLQEVCNIGSRWYMTANTPHIRFTSIHSAADVPAEAQYVLAASSSQGFEINIPKYGVGHIVCLST